MKRFIRHPADIPIEVKVQDQLGYSTHHTFNLSVGGLALRCDREFSPDDIVEIRITFVRPPFKIDARVIWCKAREGGYALGVAFMGEDDAFLARMVEQVCHIENYKNAVFRSEGRLLSPEDAALEWINKFAANFPGSSGMN